MAGIEQSHLVVPGTTFRTAPLEPNQIDRTIRCDLAYPAIRIIELSLAHFLHDAFTCLYADTNSIDPNLC